LSNLFEYNLVMWRCLERYFSYIVAVSCIGGWNWRDPQKTTVLSQVTDKLYHIMLYTSPWSRLELTTSAVIGTDCIGSCKSNYHTITATTALPIYGKISSARYYYTKIYWIIQEVFTKTFSNIPFPISYVCIHIYIVYGIYSLT